MSKLRKKPPVYLRPGNWKELNQKAHEDNISLGFTQTDTKNYATTQADIDRWDALGISIERHCELEVAWENNEYANHIMANVNIKNEELKTARFLLLGLRKSWLEDEEKRITAKTNSYQVYLEGKQTLGRLAFSLGYPDLDDFKITVDVTNEWSDPWADTISLKGENNGTN